LSPDATVLAVGAETNSVRLYKVADGRPQRRLGAPGEYWVSFVTALSFSAGGRRGRGALRGALRRAGRGGLRGGVRGARGLLAGAGDYVVWSLP
jgi:hypothetical protein